MEPRRRIAVLSFLPDTGHVVPLLRIAAALRSAGHSVRCFLPEECRALAAPYDVPYTSIGEIHSDLSRGAAASFSYSPWRSRFDPTRVFEYWFAIWYRASKLLRSAAAQIADLRPELLITDDHLFEGWYYNISDTNSAPLLLNYSAGTLRKYQAGYLFHSGPSDLPAPLRSTLFLGQWLISRPLRQLRRLPVKLERRFETMREEINRSVPEAAAWSTLPPIDRRRIATRRISVGLGLLESERFRSFGLIAPDQVQLFGPVVSPPPELPNDLSEWLDRARSGGRPVVYISFGTMLRVSKRQARIITGALEALGLAALWSVPDQSCVPASASLSIRSFFPQRAVLHHEAVACCLTHGGAGTVQESLIAGKPMLTLPILWDQYYNSSIVERLGACQQLRWTTVTQSRLARALDRLVRDTTYRDAAREVQASLQAQDGAGALLAFISQLILDAAPSATHGLNDDDRAENNLAANTRDAFTSLLGPP